MTIEELVNRLDDGVAALQAIAAALEALVEFMREGTLSVGHRPLLP